MAQRHYRIIIYIHCLKGRVERAYGRYITYIVIDCDATIQMKHSVGDELVWDVKIMHTCFIIPITHISLSDYSLESRQR